ncbi:MAG: pilus assembly PilX N-terminal domain-containing protein [Actinobacteria bacterium]|nr:pilus assembly PilX N-terminal domain-containing protein [Actinomycetota bacterium]
MSRGLAVGQGGYVLMMTLLVMVLSILIGVALIIVGIQEFSLSARTKLMDQAYLIADAGVNRATVQLKTDPTLVSGIPDGTHDFGEPGDTPQWTTPAPEQFGEGSYTVSIWQSEVNPTDPTSKVIVSTGSASGGERQVERSIEARLVVSPPDEQYDASFDYCFYNGFQLEGAGATWPDVDYLVGRFGIDGATPSEGHTPKGAVYANGNIDLPVRLAADLDVLGNVVATGDITLSNAYEIHVADPGIEIKKGNVVAGLDGTGSALVETRWTASLFQESLQVLADGVAGKGNVVAAEDITVSSEETVGFDNPVVLDGLMAGRDVTVEGTADISAELKIGPIVSGRSTAVRSRWLTGITVGSIMAGRHPDGTGVDIYSLAASRVSTGSIRSRGQVKADAEVAEISLGDVVCGNELSGDATGGTGLHYYTHGPAIAGIGDVSSVGAVEFVASDWPAACDVFIGDVTSASNVSIQLLAWYYDGSGWANMDIGNIWSGEDVDVKLRQDFPVIQERLNVGDVQAVGDVSVQGQDSIDVGDVTANGNVGVCDSMAWLGSHAVIEVGNIRSGGNDGPGYVREYLGGVGTFPGAIPGDTLPDPGDPDYNDALSYETTYNVYVFTHSDSIVDDSIDLGTVESAGDVLAFCHDPIETDKIQAAGNVRIESVKSNLIGSIGARVRVSGTVEAQGSVYCRGCAVAFQGDSYLSGGVWAGNYIPHDPLAQPDPGHSVSVIRDDALDISDTDMSIGTIPGYGSDSIRSRGDVFLEGCGDIWPFQPDLEASDIRAPGGVTTDGSVEHGTVYAVDPGSATACPPPNVHAPALPKPPAPLVGRGGDVDVEGAADLEAPVNMIQPNWSYFQQAAMDDDAVNPGAPHVLLDTGMVSDGDHDGQASNGEILFMWDSALPYSSNETVYQGDPEVDLVIEKLEWPDDQAVFEGTIVSRGDVYLDSTDVDWFMGEDDVLNIIAGGEDMDEDGVPDTGDITSRTGGLTLWERNNSCYHFWAARNIHLDNLRFSLGGSNTFRGSFTAGNRVYYRSNTFVENTTFAWSRMQADATAWLPPYRILSWREI